MVNELATALLDLSLLVLVSINNRNKYTKRLYTQIAANAYEYGLGELVLNVPASDDIALESGACLCVSARVCSRRVIR